MSCREADSTAETPETDMTAMTTIWLSYDFGIRADYEGLYSWLDKYKAKECGASLAVFNYEYSKDIAKTIRSDIKKSVKITERDRIYIIYREREGRFANKGVFIFGGRKGPPWAGYAPSQTNDVDEEI